MGSGRNLYILILWGSRDGWLYFWYQGQDRNSLHPQAFLAVSYLQGEHRSVKGTLMLVCILVPYNSQIWYYIHSHFLSLKLCPWRKDVMITLRCICPHVMVLSTHSSSFPWVLSHTEMDIWLTSQLTEQLSVFCGKKMARWKWLSYMSCWGVMLNRIT